MGKQMHFEQMQRVEKVGGGGRCRKKLAYTEIETRETLKLYEERNIISGICKIRIIKNIFLFGRTFFISMHLLPPPQLILHSFF